MLSVAARFVLRLSSSAVTRDQNLVRQTARDEGATVEAARAGVLSRIFVQGC